MVGEDCGWDPPISVLKIGGSFTLVKRLCLGSGFPIPLLYVVRHLDPEILPNVGQLPLLPQGGEWVLAWNAFDVAASKAFQANTQQPHQATLVNGPWNSITA